MVTQTAAPNRSVDTPPARESTAITVTARTTCRGAHVHIGSLKLRHEDVSEFAARYQEQAGVSAMARLTSSAVNDMMGVLAPRMGLRVHAVTATAHFARNPAQDAPVVDLRLEIESPEGEQALERLVNEWQQDYGNAALPTGGALDITWRVLDWYAS